MLIFAAELENDMEKNLLIELLEDGEKGRDLYENKQNYG